MNTHALEMSTLHQRHMFILNDDFRSRHEILTIKALSDVQRTRSRDVIVVELIDGSHVPFYSSTGKNSRLAKSWFPFFGIDTQVWFDKNYTFKGGNNSNNPNAPLYHYHCYILSRVALELNHLLISRPYNKVPLLGEHINHWIGGKLFNESIMKKTDVLNYPLLVSPPLISKKFFKKNNDRGLDRSRYKELKVIQTSQEDVDFYGAFRQPNLYGRTVIGLYNFIVTHNSTEYMARMFLHMKRRVHSHAQRLTDLFIILESLSGVDFFQEGVQYLRHVLADTRFALEEKSKKPYKFRHHSMAYLWLTHLEHFTQNYIAIQIAEIAQRSTRRQFLERSCLKQMSQPLAYLIKSYNNREQKTQLIVLRDQLQCIKRNNDQWFDDLACHNSLMINAFTKKYPYQLKPIVYEINQKNHEQLRTLRRLLDQIWQDKQDRVIQKFYNRNRKISSWDKLKERYLESTRLKKAILSLSHHQDQEMALNLVLELMGQENLESHYEATLTTLLKLKNIMESEGGKDQIKAGVGKVRMLSFWIYRDALSHISPFKTCEEGLE